VYHSLASRGDKEYRQRVRLERATLKAARYERDYPTASRGMQEPALSATQCKQSLFPDFIYHYHPLSSLFYPRIYHLTLPRVDSSGVLLISVSPNESSLADF